MKIQRLESNNRFKGAPCETASHAAFQKTAKAFAKMGNVGEGASIACDFFGKALIVPLVIMTTSKEPQDKKEYSAFKNPIAAIIQLALEVPILAAGSKIVSNCANKGMFDIEGSDFSYNEKLKRAEFIDTFENCVPSLKENTKEFIDEVNLKGYSSKVQEQFDDIISNIDEPVKKTIKSSFKEYEKTYKNQFHLKNRICFVAAFILTPLLCALENKFHPIVMNKIFKLQHIDNKTNNNDRFTTFDEFLNTAKTKSGAAK